MVLILLINKIEFKIITKKTCEMCHSEAYMYLSFQVIAPLRNEYPGHLKAINWFNLFETCLINRLTYWLSIYHLRNGRGGSTHKINAPLKQ